jgi:hypothetical protein
MDKIGVIYFTLLVLAAEFTAYCAGQSCEKKRYVFQLAAYPILAFIVSMALL